MTLPISELAPLVEHDPAHRVQAVVPVDDTTTMMDRGGPDGEVRYRVGVQARKIPHAERDVARKLMPDGVDPWVACRFRSVLGADRADDDPEYPAGSVDALDGALVYYTVMATEEQIEQMRGASNAVSVTVEPLVTIV